MELQSTTKHLNPSSNYVLDTIQASSLRLSLGEFRISPHLSLCAEAAEPPLLYRAPTLTPNFLASSAQITELPIYPSIHSAQNPLLLSLQTHLHYLLKINPLIPVKSSTPPWLRILPTIRLDLTNLQKSNNNEYKSLLSQIIAEYPDHILSYIDGSKSLLKTGYAYSIQGNITAKRMRNSASIFTAELTAIYFCPSHLAQRPP